jgi:hypothetical protein
MNRPAPLTLAPLTLAPITLARHIAVPTCH